MKKKILTVMLAVALAAVFAAPLYAASQTWDELVAGLVQQEQTAEKGAALLQQLRSEAPAASETQLWNALWVGDVRSRAIAGVALIDKIFPGGDPSKWERVQGFLSSRSYQPRQLAGIDALFVAVASLNSLEDGEWSAAYLLSMFGKSARGRIYFVEEMPAEMRPVLDSVIAKTGLKGDWSTKRTRGKMPFLPIFRGVISRDGAESRQLTYIDGLGSIANNGRYAWDRDRGYIYEVVETSSFFVPFGRF